jgi:large subunit ribosomal protein L9
MCITAAYTSKVADGWAQLSASQGLAVLAPRRPETGGADSDPAARARAPNQELSGVVEQLVDALTFPAKAGDRQLYGSITTQMIADALKEKVGVEIDRRQLDTQPLRILGEHKVNVRLTMDLVPEVTVLVYREGESLEQYLASRAVAEEEEEEPAEAEPQSAVDPEAETEDEAETAAE